jgi:hypothetical protein
VTGARLTGHFIAGPKGPIFVLLREPPDASRGCVIVVPPFAEEMNKCRRMVTEVAVGLAIVMTVVRHKDTTNIEDVNLLKG